MRMRNLLKHSDELSSSSVMCIESKMEAQSRYSYLARVEKELKALHKAQESVLVLNYYNLREFPDVLLCDEHCRKRLRKLYLKRNLITSLSPETRHLEALTELYLHSNNLTQLPSEVALLPSLEMLNVACNNITTISPCVGSMQRLRCLNVSRNDITHLPDELWQAPSLEELFASANKIQILSPVVGHCRTLCKLHLDRNKVSSLPPQLTTLTHLTELSLCGNTLRNLPNDFSALRQLKLLYVDGNCGLQCIPGSLVHAGVTLGVQECGVWTEEGEKGVVCRQECPAVLPLLELAARAVHRYLKDTLKVSILHGDLCPLLGLPSSLGSWVVPQGRCSQRACAETYFFHFCAYHMAAKLYSSLAQVEVEPCHTHLRLSVNFCSLRCAKMFLSSHTV